jgi:hypothetical protein
MNRKQLVVLVVIAVVLVGLGVLYSRREEATYRESTRRMGETLITNFPINNIEQLCLKQGDATLTLAKKNEIWTVRERGDYPANFAEISDLLRKILDLKVTQPIRVGAASSLPRLQLKTGPDTNSAVVMEFKDKNGKLLKTLLLGKKHLRESPASAPFGSGEWPDGRYVMLDNDLQSVALVSDPLGSVEPRAETWLEKEFFKVEKPRSIALVSTNATNSWKIARESETNDWRWVDAKAGEQLDPNKVSGIANALNNPSFVDVAASPKPAETGLDQPTTVTLETFDGPSYTIKVGKKSGEENYFMTVSVSGEPARERVAGKDEKPEDKEKLDKEFSERRKKLEEKIRAEKKFEPWTYMVAKYTLDPLLRDHAQLLLEKKEEPKKDEKPAEPVENK